MQSINIGYLFLKGYEFFTEASLPQGASIVAFISTVEYVLLGISIVFLIVFVYLYFGALQFEHAGFHRRQELEVLAFTKPRKTLHNDRFEQAVELANSSNPGDWRRAILEADILLGEMLREKGFPGDDIGEQLRGASRAHFSTLDHAWEAHKVRNAIAHIGETFPLSEREALGTIDNYRRVFEEFGYL